MSASRYPFHYDMPKVADRFTNELGIQMSCRERVERCFKARIIAVPNGTHIKSFAGRAKAKAEGLATGFPDCLIIGFGPNAGRTAYPEIKHKKPLSDEQVGWLTWLHDQGYDAGCFRSQDTLAQFLTDRGWK